MHGIMAPLTAPPQANPMDLVETIERIILRTKKLAPSIDACASDPQARLNLQTGESTSRI